MESAASRLKRLRESTEPRLSIRALAERLGMPASSYAFYEDPNKFKKPYLPVEFVKSLVVPLGERGIASRTVLSLSGLNDGGGGEMGDAAVTLDLVPVVSIDLEYGLGATFTDGHVEAEVMQFPRQWIEGFTRTPSTLLTFARGRGDSMMPTIHSNDMVLIDRSQRTIAEQDAIWAYAVGSIGGLKRLRIRGERVQILSDNPSVPPDEAHVEEMTIVGRVILVIKSI